MSTACRSTTRTGTSTCARRTPSRCCASPSNRSCRRRTWREGAMRSWASFAASAVAALVLAAPAAAAGAPVDEFASATGEFAQAFRTALPRAKAAAEQRQEAARECLDVLRATPEPNREPMAEAYLFDVVFGVVNVEVRPLRRFAGRLARIHLRREPALAAVRRNLRGVVAALELTALSVDDTCTM